MPVRVCAFDIETTGKNPEFTAGAVFSDDMHGYFIEPAAMVECMRQHARRGYTFFAHNAEYDTAVLLWGQGEDVSIGYSNNLYSAGRWKYSGAKKTAAIWDSVRLCAGLSLQELGRSIGIPKYPMPRKLVDSDDIRQDWVCDRHVLPGCVECYVTRDAEIVWSYINALREWLEPYGLSLRNSLARSAIELWRVLDQGASQTLRDSPIKSLARAAYHGGRCEVFQYGHVGRVYTADIRSAYGSILRSILLPDMSSLRYVRNPPTNDIPVTGDGVVEATVHIPACHVPPLPVTYGERTFYPVGTVVGAWPISEVRRALAGGVTVKVVHRIAHTDKMVQPFATTAATLLALREGLRNQNDARELVAKFMLNAIPGRLAMRDASERVTIRRWRDGMTREDMDGAELESAGGALYLAKRSSLTMPSKYANVLWAAIVLGEARSRLHGYLCSAGDSLLYCDTDSIHSLAPLPIEGTGTGMLRDTGVYDQGLYLGSKFYSLETYEGKYEARSKGIPRKHAVEFIKRGQVAYQTTLGVVDGILRGIKPCVWVDVDRVARYAPGTRTILDPSVLVGEAQRSATAPVAFVMESAALTIMQTRSMIGP